MGNGNHASSTSRATARRGRSPRAARAARSPGAAHAN